MKTRTSVYKNLQFRTGTGDAYYQIRITKNGINYDMDKIVSCDVQQMLCGSGIGVEIGQACAATCTLVLFESSANWERMAKFTVSFRIVSGDGMENTSWYDIGQFYTDTRSEDNAGRLTIIAYDSMLLMEKTWTDSIPSEDLPASFPITARAWATLIQTHNLATFADLTQLDNTIAFVGLDTTSSIRDVLKSIATVHGGNWTVLANGNLKLIQYQNLVDEDYATVSGSLVHITDALAEPAKKFVVNIEPEKVIGKNLFNKNNFVRNVGYIDPNNNRYVAGDGRVTAVLPDPIPVGTYTISRATSARLRVGLVTSTTLTDYQEVTNKVSGTNNSNSPVTITVSQSGYYLAIFFKDTADADEQNLLDHLQVEVGSSATSYEPYTCTLKGYTGVEVYHSDADTSDPTTIPIEFPTKDGIQRASLPSGYKQVEYIEGTGTQYIDTDITFGSDDFKIELEFEKTEQPTSEMPLVSIWTSSPNYWNMFIQNTTTAGLGSFDIYTSTHHIVGGNGAVGLNTKYSASLERNVNHWKATFGESSLEWDYTPSATNNTAMKVFKRGDGAGDASKIKLYSLKVSISDDLVGNFVPCVRLSDNKAGLYDTVTESFFNNAGSDDFIAGGDLSITVHGGTLDVTSGLLKAYPYYDSYNGETLTGHWISNIDEYAVGTTPTIGAQVVNDGAIPITYQITPTQITLLSGENNFWADTGNVEVTYKSQESSSTENYIDLGQAEESIETSPALPAVTGVHLETDAGTVMQYGSDSGYVVRAVCNVATTEGITEFCFTKVNHFVYKPFTAYNVCLDPAVELGDSVMINGVGYQVMALDLRLNGLITATVSAPYDQEVDHEYAVPNEDAKTYRKAMAAVEEGMSDYVTKEEHESSLVQTEQAITATVSATYVTQNIYNEQIAEIQSQLDGSIQTWSGNAVPTLSNTPAVDWTTDADKATHVGDTYFVNSDAGIPEAGSYYRFENNNGVYSWQLLNDTALTEALAKAAAAQAAAEAAQYTANGALTLASSANSEAVKKGRIFVVQPTPPYFIGDLWFNSTTSDIKVCVMPRNSGDVFRDSDWEKRDKYTDDSALTNFINNVYNIAIQSIQQQVDQKAETYYQDTDPSIAWGAAIAGIAVVGIDKIGVWDGTEHEGDLWFRTTDNTTWFFNGSEWVQQSVPQDVFDQIDGKAQIFVGQPYTPYRVGDLWFQSVNDDIKTCIANRLEGDFVEADWVKYNKYTDDTKANQVDQSLTTFKNTFSINPEDIRAEVEKRVIANKTETVNSFGWKLIDSAHIWYANGSEVVRFNQSGAYVKGEIRATTGYIGNENTGFKIEATSIRNGMTALNDTTNNGIYIGTDGVALGKGNFKVTSQGEITAKSGTIGGFTITASSMYTNGQSSYSGTGNGIHMGSSGLRIGSKFKVDTAGNVTCGNITASSGTFEGNVYAKNIQYGGSAGTLNGAALQTGTVNGSSITPLTISGGTNGQIAHQSIGSLDIASNSISGGSGGHIQSNTLTDLNVVSSGYTTGALAEGIKNTLTSADTLALGMSVSTASRLSYFAAKNISATSSMYAPEFYVELGGDNQLGLKEHYHTIQIVNGKVQLGKPTKTKPDPFDLGDAIDHASALDTNSSNYGVYDASFNMGLSGKSYVSGSQRYGRLGIYDTDNTLLKTYRVYMPNSDGELTVSVADNGVTWNNSYKMYYYSARASATCGDKSDSVTDSWYFNPTEAIEWGKSQGGYSNYVYSTSSSWTSRNGHPVCRVTTIVYGVTSGGDYVQLASGTDDYERPY